MLAIVRFYRLKNIKNGVKKVRKGKIKNYKELIVLNINYIDLLQF